jgi:hypothetical protein
VISIHVGRTDTFEILKLLNFLLNRFFKNQTEIRKSLVIFCERPLLTDRMTFNNMGVFVINRIRVVLTVDNLKYLFCTPPRLSRVKFSVIKVISGDKGGDCC